MSDSSSLENDLRAIEAINQRDVQFALAGDGSMMMSQWTDDFVLLPPVGPILRGRRVIAEAFEGIESPKIVEYVLDIQEVKVLGGKLTRILQRQPDGSWKMYRGITTVDMEL
jgi:ketosteroid isomerase-like protein